MRQRVLSVCSAMALLVPLAFLPFGVLPDLVDMAWELN
jgi:hypothetical protein